MLRTLLARLHRLAEVIAAGLLAVIFVAFIIQIALRYVFNWPVGWTAELSLVAWLWQVLWGAAFVLKDEEEIRIDFVQAFFGPRGHAVIGTVGALCLIVLFGMALPASYDYVAFMKVEKSSYLNIRFDWLYSIYIVFSLAVIARQLRAIVRLWRPGPPARDPSTPAP